MTSEFGNDSQNNSNYKTKGPPVENVLKFGHGNGNIEGKFIEPAKTFDEALANTRIIDEEFLRNIVLAHSKMTRFNSNGKFNNLIGGLTSLLTGYRSMNGIGMALASMTAVKIFYPEGAGLKGLNETSKKHLADINRIKNSQRNDWKAEREPIE